MFSIASVFILGDPTKDGLDVEKKDKIWDLAANAGSTVNRSSYLVDNYQAIRSRYQHMGEGNQNWWIWTRVCTDIRHHMYYLYQDLGIITWEKSTRIDGFEPGSVGTVADIKHMYQDPGIITQPELMGLNQVLYRNWH